MTSVLPIRAMAAVMLRGNVVFAVTRNHAVKSTKDTRGTDDSLGVAQGGQGSSSGKAIRRAHDRASATSHHKVESSKNDIAVVRNVGVDLNVAHGGDDSGDADGDREADGAFGATKSHTLECMTVDIGAVHEAGAVPVESAAPPMPQSAQSTANVAPRTEVRARPTPGRRSEPGLPHEVMNGATASTANGSGTARAEILDQACMAIALWSSSPTASTARYRPWREKWWQTTTVGRHW